MDEQEATYQFTYEHEIGTGRWDSTVPHYPGGESGVTIGPGYDMGGRSSEQIIADLTAVGIDPETANTLSEAAGQTREDASAWIEANPSIQITEEQQQALFQEVLVPEYEASLADYIDSQFSDIGWDSLNDLQREMLFDHHYNVGISEFPNYTEAVVNRDWETAAQEHHRLETAPGLAQRNLDFQTEFFENRIPEFQQVEEQLEGIVPEFKPDPVSQDLSPDFFPPSDPVSEPDFFPDPISELEPSQDYDSGFNDGSFNDGGFGGLDEGGFAPSIGSLDEGGFAPSIGSLDESGFAPSIGSFEEGGFPSPGTSDFDSGDFGTGIYESNFTDHEFDSGGFGTSGFDDGGDATSGFGSGDSGSSGFGESGFGTSGFDSGLNESSFETGGNNDSSSTFDTGGGDTAWGV